MISTETKWITILSDPKFRVRKLCLMNSCLCILYLYDIEFLSKSGRKRWIQQCQINHPWPRANLWWQLLHRRHARQITRREMGTLGIDWGIKFIFLCFWVWLCNEFEANGNKIYAKGQIEPRIFTRATFSHVRHFGFFDPRLKTPNLLQTLDLRTL